MNVDDQRPTRLAILRGEDGKTMEETGIVRMDTLTPFQLEQYGKLHEKGLGVGEEVRILSEIPGFGLSYVWFKKDYPLLLHKHDVDCLYYIIAGSMSFGTEVLGARDSVFVPKGTPYTFRAGEDGVEFLEFRHETSIGVWLSSQAEAPFRKAAEVIAANKENWKTAVRPSELAAV